MLYIGGQLVDIIERLVNRLRDMRQRQILTRFGCNNIMPITAENIVRHELIGLEVRVKKSKDPTHEKLRGKVIDESYKMIKIEGKRIGEREPKEKSIPKLNTVFMFTLPNGERVEVDGDLLVSRPEDRIKKKFDKW